MPLEEEAQQIAEFVFAQADAMIAVSPGVKQYLETFEKAKGRVHVIANGVALDRFAPAAEKNAKRLVNLTACSSATVGFLGTLKPWHGLATLVDAWVLLRKQNQNIRLLIVGDGPEFESLHQNIEQHGLLEHVTFTGAVQPEQVPEWLGQMDIAVAQYPNMDHFYFLPLKIYEYMAAGIPVVATRVGHLESLVAEHQNGELVEAENPAAMADCIAAMRNDPNSLRQLGQCARQTAEKEHSWLSVVARIIHIAQTSKRD